MRPTLVSTNELVPRFSAEERRYFEWLAKRPCVVSKRYGVQIAHIRNADSYWGKALAGGGRKPILPYVVPLAPELHRDLDTGRNNRWDWWERHGFPRDPSQSSILFMCWMLWRVYRVAEGDLVLDRGAVADMLIAGWSSGSENRG